MRVRRPGLLILICLSFYFLAAIYSAGATQKHAAHKQSTPETTVEVVPPPPPLRPEQMPAVAPQVTFQNGKLTIIARNSTLGDILRAVHTKTGANVEVSGSATERVVGMFGPGPSRDVVASLLNGSHFNYVMLGSEANPDQLQHLILTPKGAADSAAPAPTPQPVQAQNQPDVQPAPDAQDNGGDDFADADAEADASADQSADDPNAQGQQIGQPNAKTPEQMLLELQRQQQIQQQQQQQQGGAPTPGSGFPAPPGAAPPQPPH